MVAPVLQTTLSSTIKGGNPAAESRLSSPLQDSGALNGFSHSDLTPVIGREYTGLQITDILKSENSDQILKDFAVTGKFSSRADGLIENCPLKKCTGRTIF
jgi:hypothetical protein